MAHSPVSRKSLDDLTASTRKVSSTGDRSARVLFLYPNERGMSTVPAAIAILSQVLKDAGHLTALFDTTFYMFDDEIAIKDFDEIFTKSVNYRPVIDEDDEDRFFKKTTRSHY